MRLYVMRHGPAEDHASTGRDSDRELTPKGRERVARVARLLAREKEVPERILQSGLARADQTAQIVAAIALEAKQEVPVEARRELAPGGPAVKLVRVLHAEPSVMVVGHEPDLSGLIEELLGEGMPLPMDKAMVVALDVSHQVAKVRFIVEPREPAVVHDER